MSRNTSLSELINYVSASSSGNVTVAPPASGFALEVFGTGRYSGALSGSSAAFTGALTGSNAVFSGILSGSNASFTGALTGTSATFSGNVSGSSATFSATANTYANGALKLNAYTGGTVSYLTSVGSLFALSVGGSTDHLLISSSGAATFSSTVTGAGVNLTAGNWLTFGNTNTVYSNGGVGFFLQQPDSSTPTTFRNSVGGSQMTVSTNGNVLIGKTNNTGNKLQVSDGTNMFNVDYDANGPYLTSVNNQNTVYKRFTYDASEHYFNISASTKMILTSGGNIGIGTTSPSNTLTIKNSNPAANGIDFQSYASTSVQGKIVFDQGDDTFNFTSTSAYAAGGIVFKTNSTERMRIANAGYVGVGLSAPKTSLQINAGSGAYPTLGTNSVNTLFVSRDDGKLGTYFGYATDGNGWIQQMRNDSATAYNLILQPVGGNVGIGTTSPTTYSLAGRHLELNDAGGGYAFYHCNTTSVKSFFATNESAGLSALFTFSNHPLTLGTNNTERMRITSGGNVLVGTTTDYGGKLQVSGGITINGSITNLGTGTGTYTQSVWYNNTTDQVLFENGRTTDSAAGTGRTVYFTWRGGPTVGGGVQLQHGTNAWAAYTSDARLKTVVANVDNGIEAIMKLNPIKYKWTKELETSRTVLGFTAQNVGEAIPEAMFKSWEDEELGDVLSYYQEYLTPYLVKAIQELKSELDTANARIQALENK